MKKELVKLKIGKKFLHHSTNEWISLNSALKTKLKKLNTTQEEKGKIIQKLKKDDKNIVHKSCFDVASSSNIDIVENYY